MQQIYIGETGRPMQERMKEHEGDEGWGKETFQQAIKGSHS